MSLALFKPGLSFTKLQGDHNWTMKDPEILSDMRATEESMLFDIEKQWI